MSKKTSKKISELSTAIDYAKAASTQLGYHGNVGNAKETAEKLLKEMPKFKNFPKLQREYTSILSRVSAGQWTAQMGSAIFRNKVDQLHRQIYELE